ncbi:MAG TPA: HAD-IIB family hydrolase, partial [Gammaproteobacteria bacterium]|nr:HAD-IIB family hydrolase [Gammaproteobacteria bacterium]
RQWARNGVNGAHRHYSWHSHVQKYMRALHKAWGKRHRHRRLRAKSRLPTVDRIVVCELDNTLLGDPDALHRLLASLKAADGHVGLGVATGRSLDSALKLLRDWKVPTPDLLVTSVGAEIHYGHRMVRDQAWAGHIAYRWDRNALHEALRVMPGLKLQPKAEQHAFKISYFMDEKKAPRVRDIIRHLRLKDLHATVIQSRGMFLDVLPSRASKGLALRHLGMRWGLTPERFLVAGYSGNDEAVLRGNTLGVVVGNYSSELGRLRGRPRIYFAQAEYAWGIMEGVDYYDFFGAIRIPEEEGLEHDGDVAGISA